MDFAKRDIINAIKQGKFTVAEISTYTQRSQEQVRDELANCKREGFITSTNRVARKGKSLTDAMSA